MFGRATLLLGLSYLLPACVAERDQRSLAREDDRRYGTRAFTWLIEHEPSAVVAWHVPAAAVQALLPHSKVIRAGRSSVCAQTLHSHALLVLVEGRSAVNDRDAAEDCGFALDRDAGAIVVAPR